MIKNLVDASFNLWNKFSDLFQRFFYFVKGNFVENKIDELRENIIEIVRQEGYNEKHKG
ncbi:hypothetical protein JCM15060_24200 [Halanaerobaculum tunisiense]